MEKFGRLIDRNAGLIKRETAEDSKAESQTLSSDNAPTADAAELRDVTRIFDRERTERFSATGAAVLLLGMTVSPFFALLTLAAVVSLEVILLRVARPAGSQDLPGSGFWRVALSGMLTALTLSVLIAVLWVSDQPLPQLAAIAVLALALLQSVRNRRDPWILRSGLLPFATLAGLKGYEIWLGGWTDALASQIGLLILVAVLWAWGNGNRGLFPALGPSGWLPMAQPATDSEDSARFLATVGHELRTPLNGIIGMTQGLLAGQLDRDQRDKAEIIAESGRMLTALLNDLLDHSKMEAGRLEIHPVPESFHAGLRHVISLYSPVAQDKKVALRLELEPDVPDWLEHDAIRLRQCLANLVSNAIKFTDEGSVTVHVRALTASRAVGRSVDIAVSVIDTGIGLSGAGPEVLFEPFIQSKAAVMKKSGGTGLGLSIARRLARQMGGDITAGDAPQGGAEFVFQFRAQIAETPPLREDPASEPPDAGTTTGQGLRVLIVDDISTNRAVAKLFLKPLGIETLEASSGEAALEQLRKHTVDAVLLDLQMPGIRGEEVVERIRNGEVGETDLPVLAATADDRVDLRLMKSVGFDGLVLKPMDQRALQATIMSVVAARLVSAHPIHGSTIAARA